MKFIWSPFFRKTTNDSEETTTRLGNSYNFGRHCFPFSSLRCVRNYGMENRQGNEQRATFESNGADYH